MYSSPPPYLLVFFFLLLHLVPLAKSLTQFDYHCYYSDNFFPNSIYESNLNQLLDALVLSTVGPPYYGDVTYAVGVPPNRVNGEATCGYSVTTCYNCLVATRRDLQNVCYYKKSAEAYYDYCSLRYEPYDVVYTPPPPPPPPPSFVDSPSTPHPPPPTSSKGRAKKLAIYVTVPVVAVFIFLSLSLFLLWRRRRGPPVNGLGQTNEVNILPHAVDTISGLRETEISKATPNDSEVIITATNNFSADNFLGEGGCWPVYKGILPSGQVIAAKKLSWKSEEGKEQLKNEVILVSQLQHCNLARIVSYFFDNNEALIAYEYFPNTSLDKLLFDPVMSRGFNWQTRCNIIKGVAGGLMYLHGDFEVVIIHGDLKASNILLDADMNPSISDVGIAKHFKGDQTHAQAHCIPGTRAYMAPEYDSDGKYSVRSDAYSFGVLVLEIVTGRTYPDSHGSPDLINYVSDNWWNKSTLNVLDGRAGGDYTEDEVIRCINIALLCVERDPLKRPDMSWVVAMLASGPMMPLPPPPLG